MLCEEAALISDVAEDMTFSRVNMSLKAHFKAAATKQGQN